jgi:DNA-directed RNA polymerase subunit RPC12/RpoP
VPVQNAMPLTKPESMDECVYFTQRDLAKGKGDIMVWVFRQKCKKCGKEFMGKPRDASGKVKIRADEYECPACKFTQDKQEYEDSLTANAEYHCPSCGSEGEAQIQYKRTNINGIPTLRFTCTSCSAPMDVTKKMKEKSASKRADKT